MSTQVTLPGTPPARAGVRLGKRVGGLFGGAFQELRHPQERRIPFLDGLRAIAVLLVVAHHIATLTEIHYPGNLYTRFPVIANGWVGVDLFFVLSGFFIGSQLWKEMLRTGTINLPRFVLRRGFRIWPLYFATYLVLLVSFPGWARQHHYGWDDLVFLSNYIGRSHTFVRGSWSISAEEQFYALAPLALLLFRGRSLRWWRFALIGIWVLEIGARIATYVHAAGGFHVKNDAAFLQVYYPLHTRSDGLLAGLLMANLALEQGKRHGIFARPRLLFVLGLLVLLGCKFLQSETLNFAGLAIFFASALWWGLREGASFLRGHFWYVTSRLSFGMYLNHMYMTEAIIARSMGLTRGLPQAGVLGCLVAFVLTTACSMLLAMVTFCLIEHPFLVLRTAVLRSREAVPLVAH